MQTNFQPNLSGSSFICFAPTAQLGAESASVHILVADPADSLRQPYQQMIADAFGPGAQISFVRSGREAATSHQVKHFDVVILAVSASDTDAFETASQIWLHQPDSKIIFLTEVCREWHLRRIKKLLPERGLYGYILKAQSGDRIGYGIECVLTHKNIFVDPLTRSFFRDSAKSTLTDAEYDTLVDMTLGLTDRVIAARRNVSVRGIQNRITLIFQKLLDQDPLKALDQDGGTVNMRVRVVVEAIRRGLIDVEHIASHDRELVAFVEKRL